MLLAADFLRRAGWEAWIGSSICAATVDRTLRGQWFDCVQLFVDDDALAEEEIREAAAGIDAIRRIGANPQAVVIACGPAFADNRGLLDRLGADRGASNPLSILAYPDRLVGHASHKQTRRPRQLS